MRLHLDGRVPVYCRYYSELRRHNYVTPTSYLELILTFKKLLKKKQNSIQTLRERYLTGLEKLQFAASQVEVMQQEIIELQPQLIKTSEETEKLMVKIEKDTVEAEAKKEVQQSSFELTIVLLGEPLVCATRCAPAVCY